MKLPRFLIIGAMKSGTTTLYRDLITNPDVFMPLDKEPGNLNTDDVLTDAGVRRYAEHYDAMRDDQIGGDASTSYSKLPDITGVPARARRALGDELRVIYILREPVSRAISQHAHELSSGWCKQPDFNIAVRQSPSYLNYGRYAMQAAPWFDTLGAEKVMLLRFDHLVKERQAANERVCAHIGVTPRPELIDASAVFNRSEERVRHVGAAASFSRFSLYRRIIRPLLSPAVRDRIRRIVLPRIAAEQIPPTPQTVDWMIEQLAPDADALARMLGVSGHVWDPAKVRQKHVPAPSAVPAA